MQELEQLILPAHSPLAAYGWPGEPCNGEILARLLERNRGASILPTGPIWATE